MFFLDNRVKNKAGASFVAHLAQQLQYQEGTAGQTCNETEQRGSLWLMSLLFNSTE
jgi:hypothetical protein